MRSLTELVAAWLPLVILLPVFFLIGRRQMKTYYSHVEEVNRVNRELAETMKENLAVSRDSLATLTAIKSLLESRKH